MTSEEPGAGRRARAGAGQKVRSVPRGAAAALVVALLFFVRKRAELLFR